MHTSLNDVEGPGIIVASDRQQEWMLPWWWKQYSMHNAYPVTFVDFGLSPARKEWCKERGNLVIPQIPEAFVVLKEQVPEALADHWQDVYGSSLWWPKRIFWHKKPFALLSSPYKYSLWLDNDCEVLGCLEPLVNELRSKDRLFLYPEAETSALFLPGETHYNSGVIGFRRDSAEIREWAEATLSQHPYFISDENLLSRLIFEKKWAVEELSSLYNWRPHSAGKNEKALINHWVGESGKFFLSLKVQNIL